MTNDWLVSLESISTQGPIYEGCVKRKLVQKSPSYFILRNRVGSENQLSHSVIHFSSEFETLRVTEYNVAR